MENYSSDMIKICKMIVINHISVNQPFFLPGKEEKTKIGEKRRKKDAKERQEGMNKGRKNVRKEEK